MDFQVHWLNCWWKVRRGTRPPVLHYAPPTGQALRYATDGRAAKLTQSWCCRAKNCTAQSHAMKHLTLTSGHVWTIQRSRNISRLDRNVTSFLNDASIGHKLRLITWRHYVTSALFLPRYLYSVSLAWRYCPDVVIVIFVGRFPFTPVYW